MDIVSDENALLLWDIVCTIRNVPAMFSHNLTYNSFKCVTLYKFARVVPC